MDINDKNNIEVQGQGHWDDLCDRDRPMSAYDAASIGYAIKIWFLLRFLLLIDWILLIVSLILYNLQSSLTINFVYCFLNIINQHHV